MLNDYCCPSDRANMRVCFPRLWRNLQYTSWRILLSVIQYRRELTYAGSLPRQRWNKIVWCILTIFVINSWEKSIAIFQPLSISREHYETVVACRIYVDKCAGPE